MENLDGYKKGDEDKDGKYEGTILNGIPDHEGILTWPDGEKYIGEWKRWQKEWSGDTYFF